MISRPTTGLFLALGMALFGAEAYADSGTFPISVSADDGHERNDGNVNLSQDLIRIGQSRTAGLRFDNVNIPQGATITSAKIRFFAKVRATRAISITYWGEAADSSGAFSTTNFDFTNRTSTVATINDSPADWTDEAYNDSVDLTGIVQEIVDRAGWSSGNPLSLFVSDNGSGDYREFESFDHTDANSPELVVEWSSSGSMQVDTPNGGETWEVDTAQNITWTSSGGGANVKIELSRDNGSTFETLSASTLNDGSFSWTVAGAATAQALIQVTDLDTPTLTDISDAAFTIQDTAETLTVLAPNGLESWAIDSTQTISWASTGVISDVEIELSRDNGSTWESITASTPNDSSFDWTVTGPTTTNALVRITDASDATVSDTSDGTFEISQITSATYAIAAGDDDGHERNDGNVNLGASTIRIGQSRTAGLRFTEVNIPQGSFVTSAKLRLLAKIRATRDISVQYWGEAAGDSVPFSSTDFDFTNRSKTVTVINDDPAAWVDEAYNDTIDLSGIVQEIVDRADWSSGNALSLFIGDGGSADYREFEGFDHADDHPAELVVEWGDQPTITVAHANGGEIWEVGSTETITWTTAGNISNVKIELSRDGGSTWETISTSTTNNGSFDWFVTSGVTTQALLRISDASNSTIVDESDAVFTIQNTPETITVSAPNGGEVLEVGLTQTIAWSSTGVIDNVKIELSRDGGVSWEDIAATTPDDGSFDWTISGSTTTDAQIRVSDVGVSGASDLSDASFTIQDSPETITVTSPNGGEQWGQGTSQLITWNWTGAITQVEVSVSHDGGSTWSTITTGANNDGDTNWVVSGAPTTTALIRVEALDATAEDQSDAAFEIVDVPETITVTVPNSGGFWLIGNQVPISWTSTGSIDQVDIEISRDNGASYTAIATNEQNDGNFTWSNVTGPETDDALVRVVSSVDSAVNDASDAPFIIMNNFQGLVLHLDGVGDSDDKGLILSQGGFTFGCVIVNGGAYPSTGVDVKFVADTTQFGGGEIRLTTDLAETDFANGSTAIDVPEDPNNAGKSIRFKVLAGQTEGKLTIRAEKGPESDERKMFVTSENKTIDPTIAFTGQTSRHTITLVGPGTFPGGAASDGLVQVEPPDDITVTKVSLSSDKKIMEIDIAVQPGASAGKRILSIETIRQYAPVGPGTQIKAQQVVDEIEIFPGCTLDPDPAFACLGSAAGVQFTGAITATENAQNKTFFWTILNDPSNDVGTFSPANATVSDLQNGANLSSTFTPSETANPGTFTVALRDGSATGPICGTATLHVVSATILMGDLFCIDQTDGLAAIALLPAGIELTLESTDPSKISLSEESITASAILQVDVGSVPSVNYRDVAIRGVLPNGAVCFEKNVTVVKTDFVGTVVVATGETKDFCPPNDIDTSPISGPNDDVDDSVELYNGATTLTLVEAEEGTTVDEVVASATWVRVPVEGSTTDSKQCLRVEGGTKAGRVRLQVVDQNSQLLHEGDIVVVDSLSIVPSSACVEVGGTVSLTAFQKQGATTVQVPADDTSWQITAGFTAGSGNGKVKFDNAPDSNTLEDRNPVDIEGIDESGAAKDVIVRVTVGTTTAEQKLTVLVVDLDGKDVSTGTVVPDSKEADQGVLIAAGTTTPKGKVVARATGVPGLIRTLVWPPTANEKLLVDGKAPNEDTARFTLAETDGEKEFEVEATDKFTTTDSILVRMEVRTEAGAVPICSDVIRLRIVRLDWDGLRFPDGTVVDPPALNELVRDPIADQVGHRVIRAKFEPASFWNGKRAKWTFTATGTVRGALPDDHNTNLERVEGFNFTESSGESIINANGTAAVRINMPPVAFNQGRLKIEAVEFASIQRETDFAVPGVVVLDPGHGGTTTVGGSSPNNATSVSGVLEKNMTLDMARRVRDLLQAEDKFLKVILTRDDDSNVGLNARANVARDNQADLLLSIHYNGFNDASVRGTETLVRPAGNDQVNRDEDVEFAQRIQDAVVGAITNSSDRGIKDQDLRVLRDSQLGNTADIHPIRACLVEIEFITNQAVDTFFNSGANANANTQSVAEAIKGAIIEQLEN